MFALLLPVSPLMTGCKRTVPPATADASLRAPVREPVHRRRRERVRVAAISIRFWHRALKSGSVHGGFDLLRVEAVFADADRRDVPLVEALIRGADERGAVPELDACVVSNDAIARPRTAPAAWVQLLDVGDVALHAGPQSIELDVSLVPSLYSAVRGVRYDGERDNGRPLLSSGPLILKASGGDGVPAFAAEVAVPRPLHITHVGDQPVRAGIVHTDVGAGDLELRWGSVDASAELELRIGVEDESGTKGLRCRLADDGAFTLPERLLRPFRPALPRQWLLTLVRWRETHVPGFAGLPLRLELLDAVRLLPPKAAAPGKSAPNHQRNRRKRSGAGAGELGP